MNDEAVYRTAPATPGLLTTLGLLITFLFLVLNLTVTLGGLSIFPWTYSSYKTFARLIFCEINVNLYKFRFLPKYGFRYYDPGDTESLRLQIVAQIPKMTKSC